MTRYDELMAALKQAKTEEEKKIIIIKMTKKQVVAGLKAFQLWTFNSKN